ncbi:hypothetical protein ACVWZ3_001877 [Bradyrhizobium sp. i1.3.6]
MLANGSVLDVSSGGYISPQGKAKTAANGVMAGKAGSISLALYSGGQWEDINGPHHPTPNLAKPAVIGLDGTLRGYGFESNGSLRVAAVGTIRIEDSQTSSIRIGGKASTLPVSLLTGGGFGSYIIETVSDDWSGADAQIIVSAGTSLTLQQKNLASLADYTATPTGTKLGQQPAPQLALLADDRRKPVDLTLRADKIKLDTGSKIITDPKASITMAAVTKDRSGSTSTSPKPSTPDWSVPAQSVELRGTIIDHGGSVFINSLATHLSSDAKIDLSGTFVANSLFGTVNGPRTSGSYIAGGTFAVEGGAITTVNTYTDPTDTNKNKFYFAYGAPGSAGTPQQSYLVADAGAVVDVSGAAGNIQVAGARGATTSQWSWSDAGTVSADVSGFSWGGSFAAAGGRYVAGDGTVHADARANGGTILLGGGNIFLQQGAAGVISAPTTLTVSADQLAPFDNVYLYAAAAQGGAARIFTDVPGTTYGDSDPSWKALTISSSLNWTVTSRLHIAAGDIKAPGSGSIDARIAAPYVVLTGFSSIKPVAGTSTLTVNAQTIDLESGRPSNFKPGDAQPGLDFSGFGQINLIASGDLRLGTLKVVNGLKTNGNDTSATAEQSSFTGKLVSAGDLLLSAQRIYPVSAVNFTIETPGNVKFAAPANSYTGIPLSAGGGITVYAGTIEQAGNLFAPLGKIALGNTDSAVSKIITQSVVLEAGSLTSVSLADTTVPYGATSDGTNWYYNANLNPLAQPPSKGLILAGSNVTRADGSTIDLRGGGDIQAMEWIAGKGGSRDSLTTTPSGQTVYALLPSQTDPIAAYDIHFATARSADAGKTVTAGDAIPLAGTQITIDGGNGIPAGTYTLYPAHYATLPGAMRVVVYSSDNTGKNIATGTKLPDGTVLVTGHYTQSTAPGKQSSGQTVFAVQTSSVWQQYSEYSFNGANAYYAQLAAKNNVTAPRLPMDAGRLSISALQSIVMNGVARTLPGQDRNGNTGRGSELDISAPKLAVVGHAGYVNNDIPAGYVGLDVAQLNDFESILIGGSRSDFATGTLITPTASNVVVDTRGETFSAPEILLVAQQVGQWQEVTQSVTVGSQSVLLDLPVYVPEAGSGTVTINTGSIIKTTGVVHAGLGRHYVVAADGQAPVTAQSLAAALGGTLSGTEIVGADLAKLLDPTSPARLALGYYANGGAQQPGRGALFVASNDPTLQLTGPTATGVSAPAFTIKFKDVATATAVLPAGPVTGSLTLAGGDTSNSGKVAIADGVKISTNTLTLQATASNNAIAINTTDLHANLVNLIAPTIGVGAASAVAGKSLVLPANSTQFADVQTLALRALSGPVTVVWRFQFRCAQSVVGRHRHRARQRGAQSRHQPESARRNGAGVFLLGDGRVQRRRHRHIRRRRRHDLRRQHPDRARSQQQGQCRIHRHDDRGGFGWRHPDTRRSDLGEQQHHAQEHRGQPARQRSGGERQQPRTGCKGNRPGQRPGQWECRQRRLHHCRFLQGQMVGRRQRGRQRPRHDDARRERRQDRPHRQHAAHSGLRRNRGNSSGFCPDGVGRYLHRRSGDARLGRNCACRQRRDRRHSHGHGVEHCRRQHHSGAGRHDYARCDRGERYPQSRRVYLGARLQEDAGRRRHLSVRRQGRAVCRHRVERHGRRPGHHRRQQHHRRRDDERWSRLWRDDRGGRAPRRRDARRPAARHRRSRPRRPVQA